MLAAFQWGCFVEHLRHSAAILGGEALKTIGRPLGLTNLIFRDKGGKYTSTITANKWSFILISARNTPLTPALVCGGVTVRAGMVMYVRLANVIVENT